MKDKAEERNGAAAAAAAAAGSGSSGDDGGNEKKAGGVQFGTVHVHEHRMTLGDHPGTRHGVPVALSWDKIGSQILDLEKFEEQQQDHHLQQGRIKGAAAATTTATAAAQSTSSDAVNDYQPRHVNRIRPSVRQRIAEQHHTRSSIIKVQEDVKQIQLSRQRNAQGSGRGWWKELWSSSHVLTKNNTTTNTTRRRNSTAS